VRAVAGIMTTCRKQIILTGVRIDARLPAAGRNPRCG
jgi:hypothetical protein